MFSAGTRVCACYSAVTGKKLGPKRYSLGYVSDSGGAYHIKYVKNFPVKNQAFVFIPLKIVFTRYGKEKRRRCETRSFLQIFPIFKENKTQVAISGLTKQVISIFNDGELHKNTNWQDLCSNYVRNRANIGTIIPVGHIQAVRMDSEEIIAWISSILRNRTFKNLVVTNKNLYALKKLVNDTDLYLFFWLSNAVRLSKIRQDLISWTKKNSENMNRLVNLLQRINTAFNKRLLDYDIINGQNLLNGGSIQINSYLTWLTNGMFDNERIIGKKGNFIQKTMRNSDVYMALARNMESIRHEYLNLKHKYV